MNFSLFMLVSCCRDCPVAALYFLNASSILRFDIRAQIAVNEVSGPNFKSGGRKSRMGPVAVMLTDGATGQVDG
jgi:hypothetical protein